MMAKRLAMLAVPVLSFAATLVSCRMAPAVIETREEYYAPLIFEEDDRAILPEGVEPRKVTQAGLDLTASQEGLRLKMYNDAAGFCTIGYGHLIKRAVCDDDVPEEFKKGLTKQQAKDMLAKDMARAERAVQLAVTVPLTDGQFDAVADFTFNCGPRTLKKSTFLTYLNKSQYEKVPDELRRFVLAGGKKLTALVNRREKEIVFWNGGAPTRGIFPEDLQFIDILVEGK